MKKILSNGSIRNKTLRERSDLSPLLKTYVHRTDVLSAQECGEWWNILSEIEKLEIERYYGESFLRMFDKTPRIKKPKFERFEIRSMCCLGDVRLYRGKNVGFPECQKCGEQCEFIEPKTEHDNFQFEMWKKIENLDYYEKNKKLSSQNYEKMQLLNEVFDVWKETYFEK